MSAETRVQVLDADVGPELEIIDGGGRAHAIIWPGMGAELRSMNRVSLEAGAATIALSHPGEAVYYVVSGSGEAADPAGGEGQPLEPGTMVHVGPATPYVIRAGDGGLDLVGGPSPPDPALYERTEG